ncbi:MAG: tripartite tricarboxylate transporter permease [Phreatobacter sp.]|jgi:putative tricarboxylic transport membrane protein|uniref:tripartite tricarboxylate transporter permease n=1 Tax=Phreatobacter sp. TaxID=1966341 RepID=UPI00403549D8
MDLLSNMALGFQTAFSPENLAYCFLGVFLGTFIGVLPGIGALAAVSMILPVTFYLSPTAALVMLAGVYYGAEYGGSIASILLNLPGTPSAAVTCLDGYPMAQQGRAGEALFMTTVASFVGGSVGIVLLMGFAPLLSQVALAFGAADYFAVMLFGLLAASAISQGTPIKGIVMVVLGVLIGCIGADLETGADRFTMGFHNLFDGVSIIALAMGLFGISEIIASIRGSQRQPPKVITFRSMLPRPGELKRSILPMARGATIGSFFGTLPGTGQTIAAFMSYAVEKKVSRTPERFGKGAIEGIMGPESANNAAAQTAFIPTLTMGIPGAATMALMLGALMIHGITPGPMLMTSQPQLFWGLVASFWIGNVLLVILNVPLIGLWVRILTVPYHLLYPAILVLICIGVYSVNNNVFDVYLALAFGVIGYTMRVLGFEPAPLLIGFVLGPMIEENFRRAMLMARGDYLSLFDRPISATLLALCALLLAWTFYTTARQAFRRPRPEPEAAV